VDAVVRQPSGKLLLFDRGAESWGLPETSNGVARLNADGSLDTSFGVKGWVFQPLADYALRQGGFGRMYAPLSDGSFLLRDGADKTLRSLARYTADGQRDPTFTAELPLPARYRIVGVLADDADGLLVTTVHQDYGACWQMAV
jgi:hypothetical protein